MNTVKKGSASEIYKQSIHELFRLLSSDVNSGLNPATVKKKQEEYGYNEIPEEKSNGILQFLKRFWNPAAWMLELIIAVSWFLNHFTDLLVVIILLLVNAVLSFIQEQKASAAVSELKNRLRVYSKVLRENMWKKIPARELVPGDIVRVRGGDFIPADSKIINGDLETDQSTLTGESLPVEKSPEDVLYSGSVVTKGEATAIIIATGKSTYFGKIIDLVETSRPKMHFEKVISKLTFWLLGIVFIMLTVVFITSLSRKVPVESILPLLLVLLLSAVPVALPAMFTISMALGSKELVKKNILLTRLNALEDAARMDILCIDKTGTITLNKLKLVEAFGMNGFSPDDVIFFGALASQEANQDPIDLAFLNAAKDSLLSDSSFIVKEFVPFDPKKRRTEVLVQKEGHEFWITKGAVKTISEIARQQEKDLKELNEKVSGFSAKGFRVIAVAKSNGNHQPELVGLAALQDPIRPGTQKALKELKDLGISIKLLTGDALVVAKSIAASAGLDEHFLDYSQWRDNKANVTAQMKEAIGSGAGFAEVYPADKHNIVKILQKAGHVVGMTGDGVNDAPALRQAEVGIAVDTATDAAKGAASVVLTKPGLGVIADLVKTGRSGFQRINTWVLNKLTRTTLKVLFVSIAFLVTGKYVITSSAMLVLLFMTDFVKLSLATDNVRIPVKPEKWNLKAAVGLMLVIGILMTIEALAFLYVGIVHFHFSKGALSTFSFEVLFFFAIASIFIVRERGRFWHSLPGTTLMIVIAIDAVVAICLATFGWLGFGPIPIHQTLWVIGYSFFVSFCINDYIKYLLLKNSKQAEIPEKKNEE